MTKKGFGILLATDSYIIQIDTLEHLHLVVRLTSLMPVVHIHPPPVPARTMSCTNILVWEREAEHKTIFHFMRMATQILPAELTAGGREDLKF